MATANLSLTQIKYSRQIPELSWDWDNFLSTSLPLTSTRWVQSTIKLCTVHSLTSAFLINSATSNLKKNRERRISNPGLLDENQERYPLFYAANPGQEIFILISYVYFVGGGHYGISRRVEVLKDGSHQPSGDAAAPVANVNGDVFFAFDCEHWKRKQSLLSCEL